MALTTPRRRLEAIPASSARKRALVLVEAGAAILAIASGLMALLAPAAVVAVAVIPVFALLWCRAARARTVFLLASIVVVTLDAMGPWRADPAWVAVSVIALVVAGVLHARIQLVEMEPLTKDTREVIRVLTQPRWIIGPALGLALVALVAFTVGPEVELPGEPSSNRRGGSVEEPGRSFVPGSLGPYLGLQDQLDTAVREEFGDDVVLRVEADAPDFWRGQSFDRWDGRWWSRSSSASSAGSAFASDATPSVAIEWFEQRVRVEAPAIGELFAAYRPIFVDLPPRSVRYAADGALELRRPLGRGSEYTVTSKRARVTADLLRSHDPLRTRASPAEGTMEGPVSERVERLARRVTRDAPTAYDVIRAVEKWLGEHTTYATDVPHLAAGADAVEQHLFVDRRGTCVQVATSAAAMLHSLGIPVRLGVGFVPGDESLFSHSFAVRAKDAHAWVEVWFPRVGWQAFDPTANVPLSGEYDRSFLARLVRALERYLGVVVVLLAVAAAAAIWWWFRRRRHRVEPSWVEVFFRRIESEGRKRGRPRAPAETPAAYLAALGDGAIDAPTHLALVEQAVTAAAYGPVEPDVHAKQAAEEAWRAAVRS